MKTIIALACLIALSAQSHATGEPPAPKPAGSKASAGATAAAQARQSTRVNTSVTNDVRAVGDGSRVGSDVTVSGAERSAPGIYGVATPPAADTCAKPGLSIGGSSAGGGGLLNFPTGESSKCDVRADAHSMRYTGQPAEVIKARYCMDPQLAEAYARAGQPCRDARPPAPQAAPVALSDDPLIRARQMRANGG